MATRSLEIFSVNLTTYPHNYFGLQIFEYQDLLEEVERFLVLGHTSFRAAPRSNSF